MPSLYCVFKKKKKCKTSVTTKGQIAVALNGKISLLHQVSADSLDLCLDSPETAYCKMFLT